MHMGVLCINKLFITKYARDKATHNLNFHLKIEPNEIFGKCRERVREPTPLLRGVISANGCKQFILT